MAKFRKVEFEMARGNGYGQYKIIAENYKGKKVVVHCTDSQVWDWLDDDTNKKRELYARRYCYNRIVEAYENM